MIVVYFNNHFKKKKWNTKKSLLVDACDDLVWEQLISGVEQSCISVFMLHCAAVMSSL